ncbi:hypothetical protein M2138_000071 [Dysgonomonadaceae bacterium PH5-43]|nr:hypothetical protein [Dysgonomonadaceae bacterium PH5-43]
MNKKLLLLFICGLMAVCSFAQNKTNANHENTSALLFRNNPKVKGTPSVNPFLQLRSDAVKQKLDSMTITNNTKQEFTYDDNNNIAMLIFHNWIDNVWVKDDKTEISYDDNEDMFTSTHYYWGNNVWVSEYKFEMKYDASDNEVMSIEYIWDSNKDIWEKRCKYEYEYDDNGNQTMEIGYSWKLDKWEEYTRREYKNDYTYDNGNIKTLIISYKSENEWKESEKYEYAYDAQNNIITKIRSRRGLSDWIKSEKDEYAYDNNGNLILEAYYEWDSNWIGNRKFEYKFDLSVPITDVVFPYFQGENNRLFVNKPIGGKKYKWSTGKWQELGDYIFYYSDYKPNSIDEVSNLSLSVYPNPVQEYLFITTDSSIDRVEIYNQIGSLVKTESNVSDKIDVSALNAGVYYLSIYLENKQVTKKIIKTP